MIEGLCNVLNIDRMYHIVNSVYLTEFVTGSILKRQIKLAVSNFQGGNFSVNLAHFRFIEYCTDDKWNSN